MAAAGNDRIEVLTAGRGRHAGWIGTLLLCMMLAAAGIPKGTTSLVDATRVELGLGQGARAHGPSSGCVEAMALAKGSVLAAATTMLPRAVPRARSIRDGGLPPPRAPTA